MAKSDMKAQLTFALPDEQAEFDAAIHGRAALAVLIEIDQRLRSLLKYGTPTDAEARLADEIREMIPGELLEL